MSSRKRRRNVEAGIGVTKEDSSDEKPRRKRPKGAMLDAASKNDSAIVADDCLPNGQTKSRGRPRKRKILINDSSASGCDDSVGEEGGFKQERAKITKMHTSDAETKPPGSDGRVARKRGRPSSNLSKDVSYDDDVDNNALLESGSEKEQQDSVYKSAKKNCESGIHKPKKGRPRGSGRNRGDVNILGKFPTESCEQNSGDILSKIDEKEDVSDILDKTLNKSSSKRGRPRGSVRGRGRGRGILKVFNDMEENFNEDGKRVSNACNKEKLDEMGSKSGDIEGNELKDVRDALKSTPVQETLRGSRRGRGRPRKTPIANILKNDDDNSDQDVLNTSADNSQELLNNARNEGNLTLDCSADLSPSGTTRKRGRPRGSGRGTGLRNVADVSFGTGCEDLTERSARKRQRPSYLSSDDEGMDTTTVTPKRGRGRPSRSSRRGRGRGRGRGALGDSQDDGDVCTVSTVWMKFVTSVSCCPK